MSTAILLASALSAPLVAGPPTVEEPVMTVMPDRETVQGEIKVTSDLDVLRALVRDPHATAAASEAEDLVVEDVGVDGPCRLVRWTVGHPIKTVRYTGRMCPTDDGAAITLVESDDMAEYESTWEVVPADDGSVALRCRVRSKPAFPLPNAVVRSQLKKELGATLARIKATLERPAGR